MTPFLLIEIAMYLCQVALVLTVVAMHVAVQAEESALPQPLDPIAAAERARLGQTLQHQQQRIVERRPQAQRRITAET